MHAANRLRTEMTSVQQPGAGRNPRYNTEGSCGIAIMAKASVPGRTKTRLVPPLTFEQAAALNTAFLQDMTGNLIVAASHTSIAGHVAFSPCGAGALFHAH